MAPPVGIVTSVNVGEPRIVEWFDREVETAIWKEPVAGRVAVAGVNLAGDLQSDRRVHGGPDKAVYTYAAEDYEWWADELGRDLAPGTFGENLTTRGIDLASAAIGERWSIGTAVLEASQPRQPCFKLGIRMGDAAFVERFEQAGRPGLYLRIVGAGAIGAGDDITLLSRPDHGVTAGFVARMLRDGDADGLELLAATADVPDGLRAWAARQLGRRT